MNTNSENASIKELNKCLKSFLDKNLKDKTEEIEKLKKENKKLLEEVEKLRKELESELTIKRPHRMSTDNIFDATKKGYLEAVKYWMGFLPSDFDRNSPVHYAAERNFTHILNYFTENNINLDTKNFEGLSPLHLASKNNHLESVKILIENGANIDSRDNKMQTPLHLATLNCHKEIIDYLLSKGANIEAKNEDGLNTLYYAYRSNNSKIVESIISRVANKNLYEKCRKYYEERQNNKII